MLESNLGQFVEHSNACKYTSKIVLLTRTLYEHSHSTLYRKSDLCIPRHKPARPRYQFLHSLYSICERFLYCQNWSAYLAAAKYADRSWECTNLSQIHECGNWETELYHFILDIMRPRSFISGNT
jgi:hypothetical protein